MERRNFLKQNLMASGALLSTSAFANTKMSPIEESTFKLNYGFHDGMFKSHAGNDFIEQINFSCNPPISVRNNPKCVSPVIPK